MGSKVTIWYLIYTAIWYRSNNLEKLHIHTIFVNQFCNILWTSCILSQKKLSLIDSVKIIVLLYDVSLHYWNKFIEFHNFCSISRLWTKKVLSTISKNKLFFFTPKLQSPVFFFLSESPLFFVFFVTRKEFEFAQQPQNTSILHVV